MKKTLLITGAAGFIGRYVAKEFAAQGYYVVGMGWGKFPEYADWGLSEWHECDVTIETLCAFANQPDLIVHCAGGSSVGYSVEYPRQDFCLTVDASSNVLEYMRLHSPDSRLIYPSSAAVYGQVEGVPISENIPLNPISPYGIHKLIVEQLCQMYARNYTLPIAVVRLFSIYGNGLRKQLLWDACQKLNKKNDHTFFGTGEEIRDWLHVQDVSKLFVVAAKHANSDCPIVNAGSGIGVKVKDILDCLNLALRIEKKPVFSSEVKEGDPNAYIADISTVEAWGWHANVDWYDGVKAYVTWYKTCN